MVDPYVGQDQAKSYADGIEAQTGVRPIIYFTNGYETHMWDDKIVLQDLYGDFIA